MSARYARGYTPGYPDTVPPTHTAPPAHSPAAAPGLASLDGGAARLCAGALRHLAARAATATADRCLRLARRLADYPARDEATARKRAVAASHPSTWHRPPTARPHLRAVPSLADGRFDLQFTHTAGHGASEGDPDL